MVASNPAIPGGLAGLGQLKELRQRLLFVLFALFVFRVCTHVPVPGINPVALAELFNQQRGTILDMFNMFSLVLKFAIYPSFNRTSAIATLSFDDGIDTSRLDLACPFRIRVSISAIGSCKLISRIPIYLSPAI